MKFGWIENNDDLQGLDLSLPNDNQLTKSILNGGKVVKPKIYIGCPVWSQKGYVGTIYPKGTKAKDYLAEYCKQFNCIEVNATRYGTPKLETIKQWKAAATEGFKFSLKVPQILSHRKDIADSDALRLLDGFIIANNEFGDNMGTAFLQLPPYFSPEKKEQLERFLNFLPNDFPISVELRHQDWFTEDRLKMAFDILSERNCGFIVTDSAGRREVIHQTMTNKSLMVRFVGQKLHETDFKRIDDWVNKIIEWIDNGLEEIYFFMHQPEPHKYLSANLASYMIKELNKKIPNLNLKPPIDYSNGDQQILF